MFTKTSLLLLIASLILTPLAHSETTELKDEKDKLSYSIGLEAGETLKKRSFELDEATLQAGIADGLSGKKPLLSEAEVKAVLRKAQNQIMAKRAADRKSQGEKNAVAGPKFLAENKAREGVKTTASGLQYKVMEEGSGPMPKETDTVVVNFTGSTIDGKEFENTSKSGHAETLPINRMIKGWREGFQMMKVGAKNRLFVPADLAYGKNGAGAIAPNAALIFDLELVGIVPEPSTVPPTVGRPPEVPDSPKKP